MAELSQNQSRLQLPFILGCSLLLTCLAALQTEAAEGLTPVRLNSAGSMQEMYKSNAAAKIELSRLQNKEHLYELGPLSGLRGEILIWDSELKEARMNQGNAQLKSDWNESAAFLVWSQVPRWKKIALPDSVQNMQMLDMYLASLSGPGAPMPYQFPFLLKGKIAYMDWHILSRKPEDTEESAGQTENSNQGKQTQLSQREHEKAKFKGRSRNLKVEILGFFAPQEQGVFIPKGRACHMHFRTKTKDEELIGHLDNFEIGNEHLTLYIPDGK